MTLTSDSSTGDALVVRHAVLLSAPWGDDLCLQDRMARWKSSLLSFELTRSDEMLPRVGGLTRRLREAGAAFGAVVRNPNLRRLEVAWAWTIVGHWTYLIAVSVYAYEQGGEAAVGLVFALRLLPAAFIAPFAGLLADRYRRELVLLVSAVVRMTLVAAAHLRVRRRPGRSRLRARRRGRDRPDTRPLRSGRAHPVARRIATGADGGERGHEHDREPGGLRRPRVAGVLLATTSTGSCSR